MKMPRLTASLPKQAATQQKRRRRNPTLATLLQQPNSSGDGVNHEGCNLWMRSWSDLKEYDRVVTFVHIGVYFSEFP